MLKRVIKAKKSLIFTAPDGVYVAVQMKNSQVFVNVHHLEPLHHFTSQASLTLMDKCFIDDVQRVSVSTSVCPDLLSLRSVTFKRCVCVRACACLSPRRLLLPFYSHVWTVTVNSRQHAAERSLISKPSSVFIRRRYVTAGLRLDEPVERSKLTGESALETRRPRRQNVVKSDGPWLFVNVTSAVISIRRDCARSKRQRLTNISILTSYADDLQLINFHVLPVKKSNQMSTSAVSTNIMNIKKRFIYQHSLINLQKTHLTFV